MTIPLINQVLPPGVVAVEAYEDPADPYLFPAESAVVAGAVPKRRREFATVRDCARRALAQLGYPPVPLLPGERGAPQWPEGAVGSMTHCDGYRAAAVARTGSLHSLGIDAEPHQPLPKEVLSLIASAAEIAHLRRLAAADASVCWERLLFCAKEAIYKAWFPLTRRWLDFLEATVTIDPGGSFSAQLLVAGPTLAGAELTGFAGRWATANDLLATAVTVPVESAAGGAPARRPGSPPPGPEDPTAGQS